MFNHTITTNTKTYTFTADHEYDFDEIQAYLAEQGDTAYTFTNVEIVEVA